MRIRSFLLPILIFAVAFGIGLSSLKLGKSRRNVPIVDSFTYQEAISKLRKRVRSTCVADNIKSEETTGRTMFVQKDEMSEGYNVAIDWDHSIRGKHEILFTPKETYTKCIVEIGEAEE